MWVARGPRNGRLSLCELFGVNFVRYLAYEPSVAARNRMEGSHCVSLSPCPSVTQYILATLKPQKSRGCRFIAKPNVSATLREELPAIGSSVRVADHSGKWELERKAAADPAVRIAFLGADLWVERIPGSNTKELKPTVPNKT